ncbi:MAG TPA: M1 family aminopeptidase, partial [Pyrinomonadaceae bacterium]|nr:M1 family aminopeptidase [Pyrinomonadaceae bacterium]
DEPNKPKQIWSQGETEFNRYWFPSYDTPNDFRTTELKATVAKPFTVVSNGKLVSTTENTDGTRTFYWKMDTPYANYLTSIVVGEFTTVEQNYDGIPVLNFGYTNETKEVVATVKNLPDMIKFFSEKTGVRYPYPKYAQTMVEDFGGGMENISATTQIEEMIHDEREMLDEDSDSLQAHELAHQWFGDLVTCRDWGQIWLNESFATYMDALYNEHSKGHDDFLYANVRDNQNQYFTTWNAGNRRPIVTKNYANKDAMFDSYAYPRGAAVLHMLRKHLGDELFWKSLNHYLTSNLNQPVSTEELRIAIEETTGQSMDWFFDEWLYKMGHPIFDVTDSYDAATKKLTLNVKQTQKIDPNNEFPQVEFFQSYVDVEIDDKVERVWLKPQAENVFTFESAAKPKLVNFDFEGTLIKEIKFEKSVDDLIYQMLNDKDVLGKRWAMAELEKKVNVPADKQKIVPALVAVMEKDKFWRLRRAALSVVKNIYSPEPPPGADRPTAKLDEPVLQAVLRLTKDPNSLVRSEAIALVGETKDLKYADLFVTALGDQSYAVIDQAALALARVKSPKALDQLAKLTNSSSWHGRIEIAGLNGLAELSDKKAFEPAYKLASDKTKPLNVRLAALAVVGSTGKGDARAFPLIFEKFKQSLDANDFNDLIHGIEAIIKLADPRGQEAFDLMKAKFKDQPELIGGVNFFEQQFKAALKK